MGPQGLGASHGDVRRWNRLVDSFQTVPGSSKMIFCAGSYEVGYAFGWIEMFFFFRKRDSILQPPGHEQYMTSACATRKVKCQVKCHRHFFLVKVIAPMESIY